MQKVFDFRKLDWYFQNYQLISDSYQVDNNFSYTIFQMSNLLQYFNNSRETIKQSLTCSLRYKEIVFSIYGMFHWDNKSSDTAFCVSKLLKNFNN